jgi:RNA polymerase sigma-70 factor (ECF subfamily)
VYDSAPEPRGPTVIRDAEARSPLMNDSVDTAKRHARFEALCGRLRPDLYRFAFWLARDRTVAEDVVQDTLLRAWRSFESLGDEAAARPWLLTIARREFARRFERKTLETVDVADLDALEDTTQGGEDAQQVVAMRTAILALEADYREPIVLQVLMGYSTTEIAQHLGLTTGAVLTRLFRARQKLRAALSAGEGES